MFVKINENFSFCDNERGRDNREITVWTGTTSVPVRKLPELSKEATRGDRGGEISGRNGGTSEVVSDCKTDFLSVQRYLLRSEKLTILCQGEDFRQRDLNNVHPRLWKKAFVG